MSKAGANRSRVPRARARVVPHGGTADPARRARGNLDAQHRSPLRRSRSAARAVQRLHRGWVDLARRRTETAELLAGAVGAMLRVVGTRRRTAGTPPAGSGVELLVNPTDMPAPI